MSRRTLLLFTLLLALGAAWVSLRRERTRLPPPPSPERLAALRSERDALQASLRTAVAAKGEKSLKDAPRAGVMIGIPTTLTASVIEQVVTGLFGETTLTLRNLKVHKDGEVKAKMLFTKRKLGRYALDVDLREVQGVLRPEKPTLSFGRDEIGLVLPVRLETGRGDASLHFKWDSKGLSANMVCGDVEVTRDVTGGVVPDSYTVSGRFAIGSAGQAILLRPEFPDLAVKIHVDPSEQAWAVVDEVVKAQRKGCEIALNKVDIKEKLAQILGRGFNVKIPQKIFKPIRLPAGLSQSLEVQGIKLALQVKATGVMVASDRLWYGADVALGTQRAGERKPPQAGR